MLFRTQELQVRYPLKQSHGLLWPWMSIGKAEPGYFWCSEVILSTGTSTTDSGSFCFLGKDKCSTSLKRTAEGLWQGYWRWGSFAVYNWNVGLFSGVELEMVLIHTQCNFLPKCSAISPTDWSFNPSVHLSAFKTPLWKLTLVLSFVFYALLPLYPIKSR